MYHTSSSFHQGTWVPTIMAVGSIILLLGPIGSAAFAPRPKLSPYRSILSQEWGGGSIFTKDLNFASTFACLHPRALFSSKVDVHAFDVDADLTQKTMEIGVAVKKPGIDDPTTVAIKEPLFKFDKDQFLTDFNSTKTSYGARTPFSKLVDDEAQRASQLPVTKNWPTNDPSGRIHDVRTNIVQSLVQAPKKTVSVHSMLATSLSGMIILSLSLIWSPGVNQFGIFQFTDLFKTFSQGEETIMKLTSILAVIVAITGQFRIPPKSPASRRLMFDYSAYMITASAIMLHSNLSGFANFTFDAWTLMGKIAILIPIIGAFVTSFRLIDDSIAGPLKGRETLPMMATRRSAFLTSVGLVFSLYFQLLQLAAPMLTTKAAASTWKRGLNVSSLMLGGVVSSSLFSLVPTLRFTNKLGNMGCYFFLLCALLSSGVYDGYRYAFVLEKMFAGFPEYLKTMETIMQLLNSTCINQLLVAGSAFVTINAFRRKSNKRGVETSKK